MLFLELLTLLLIYLKATRRIDLDWFWVLFPAFFPVGLVLIQFAAIAFAYLAIMSRY